MEGRAEAEKYEKHSIYSKYSVNGSLGHMRGVTEGLPWGQETSVIKTVS